MKKTSDNPPFQPHYSNPYAISFQKMHILSVVQFMLKKTSPTGLWHSLSMTPSGQCYPSRPQPLVNRVNHKPQYGFTKKKLRNIFLPIIKTLCKVRINLFFFVLIFQKNSLSFFKKLHKRNALTVCNTITMQGRM